MKEIINVAQKKVIEDLMNASTENADAIVAMGKDMFHQGQVKGMVIGGVAVALGMTIGVGGSVLVMYAKAKKQLEEVDEQMKKGGEQES